MRHTKSTLHLCGTVAALALAAGLLLLAPTVEAQDGGHKIIPSEDFAFGAGPPSLPAGVEMVVLSGNPGAEGIFVLRLKFPANYTIPPHMHAQDEIVTVISGRIGLAMGETLNRDIAPFLAPGSYAHMPANMAHSAWTEEESVVQLFGMGPFDITYVQNVDDPRIN